MVNNIKAAKMEGQGNRQVIPFDKVIGDVVVKDPLRSSNSSRLIYPLKCKEKHTTVKVKSEDSDLSEVIVGLCDVEAQSDNCGTSSVTEEETETYDDVECVIMQENPDDILRQDPLLLTEQDYLNFRKKQGQTFKMEINDIYKTNPLIKDLRIVLERIDEPSLTRPVIKKENAEVTSPLPLDDNTNMDGDGSFSETICASETNEGRKGLLVHVERRKLTAKEEERRLRRRESNKIASWKNRLKKREQTVNLMHETETLETQNQDLKNQIEHLEAQRRCLMKLLQTHRSNCLKSTSGTPTQPSPQTKTRVKCLTAEERRQRRRQVNKEAAIRCRLKKRELSVNLAHECETLETRNEELKSQIQSLENQRRCLMELLNVRCYNVFENTHGVHLANMKGHSAINDTRLSPTTSETRVARWVMWPS